jgi:hypothetical protein
MYDDIDHGFDWLALRHRLEDWLLEFFAWPYMGEPHFWPGGRREAIQALPSIHWGEHGVPVLFPENGRLVPAPRCAVARCRVLGVSLAILELDAYEGTLAEGRQAAELRRQAADQDDLSELQRAQLLARARELKLTPPSRAVGDQARGRPKRGLAQAIAQHLAQGGFSKSQIGGLMATSPEVARKRCAVGEQRSLGTFMRAD